MFFPPRVRNCARLLLPVQNELTSSWSSRQARNWNKIRQLRLHDVFLSRICQTVTHFFPVPELSSRRMNNWTDSVLTACASRSQHSSFNQELIWRHLNSLGVSRRPICVPQVKTSSTSPRWNHMYSNTQPRRGMWLSHFQPSFCRNHLVKSSKRPAAKYFTVYISQMEWECDSKFQQKLMPYGHSLTQHHASSIPIPLQSSQKHYNVSAL